MSHRFWSLVFDYSKDMHTFDLSICDGKCPSDVAKYNVRHLKTDTRVPRGSTTDRNIVVGLHPGYTTVQEIRLAKSYIELLAEIGGHLGLFVGVSVLTVAEIFELMAVLFIKCCIKVRFQWKRRHLNDKAVELTSVQVISHTVF